MSNQTMTIPYDATDESCTECGEPVEDYTGHSGASEVTLCETCPDELETEKWQYRVDIVHRIPRATTDDMSSDIIYDTKRHEYSDSRVSLDFRIRVPKETTDDLKSSATIEEGLVDSFELRLGLLARELHSPEEIRTRMNAILNGMDLPRTRYRAMRERIEEESEHDDARFPQMPPEDEMTPKVSYDPQWGEIGYYQIHLKCHSFYPPILNEEEFDTFVREFTDEFIDAFEWDEVDDE